MTKPTLHAVVGFCLFGIWAIQAWSQQPAEPPLRIRDTVPLAGDIDGILHPIKCDAKGYLYLRAGSGPSDPVRKVSDEGKISSVFRLEDAPEFASLSTFDDFSVDPRGNVYLLAYGRKGKSDEGTEQVILVYDSDGKYKSTIRLNLLLNVGRLAVFSSGELLVGGEGVEKVDGELRGTGKPFVGIFDRDGRLMREFTLPQDVQREDKKSGEEIPSVHTDPSEPKPTGSEAESNTKDETNPSQEARPLERKDFLRSLSLGSAVAADDGNIYLMRATSNPVIYAITPNGTVLRRFEIPAPSEHSAPIAFQAAAGKMAVMFALAEAPRKFKGHLFTIVNAYNGEILAQYAEPPDGHVSLACYTANGFTLIGVENNRFVVKRTYPY